MLCLHSSGPAHLCAKDSKVCWACVVLPDSGLPQKASLGTPRAPAAVTHGSSLRRGKEYVSHTHCWGMKQRPKGGCCVGRTIP